MSEIETQTAAEIERQRRKDYNRGWYSSLETGGGVDASGRTGLERADDRGECRAWYLGWSDHACDLPKWHSLGCTGCDEFAH